MEEDVIVRESYQHLVPDQNQHIFKIIVARRREWKSLRISSQCSEGSVEIGGHLCLLAE